MFFEDSKAALFGRRGKDGGQDARSGDGTRVFQAKHHEDGSSAKAISDARKEAAKILDYRKPGHARHDQWKGVTHWRQLEAIYAGNDLAREFEPLLSDDEWEQMGPRCAWKAAELAGVSNPAEIDSFIDRAIRFMGIERSCTGSWA